MTDNGVGDADPVIGKFKLLGLNPGTYKVCETVAPTGYAMTNSPCLQFTVEANGIGGTNSCTWPCPTSRSRSFSRALSEV